MTDPMTISGPDRFPDVELYVNIPYELVLRVLRELDPNEPHQRKVADELIEQLPYAIAARVQVEDIERELSEGLIREFGEGKGRPR